METKNDYNGITYAVCYEAVKKGFESIGGIQNAPFLNETGRKNIIKQLQDDVKHVA